MLRVLPALEKDWSLVPSTPTGGSSQPSVTPALGDSGLYSPAPPQTSPPSPPSPLHTNKNKTNILKALLYSVAVKYYSGGVIQALTTHTVTQRSETSAPWELLRNTAAEGPPPSF